MKTKHLLVTALLAFTGVAGAQTTTTWIGNNNNSLTATGTAADAFQNGGWKDLTVNQAISTPDNSNPNQFNAANLSGDEQGITIYGFGGLTGLTAASVLSASLYANVSNVNDNVNSGNVTFEIHGILPGLAGFDENNTTWSTINNTSLTGNYGTFTITSNDAINGTWVNYDVTNALKDYLNGTIGGIAFSIDTPGATLTGNELGVAFDSQENPTAVDRPGILVTSAVPVPEPSGALLIGCFGVASLLRRARRTTKSCFV